MRDFATPALIAADCSSRSEVVIQADGLGKSYTIGHRRTVRKGSRDTLRDALATGAQTVGRAARGLLAGRSFFAGEAQECFWALRDVSFEIRRGDVVGIVGHNGAGKSTLLKILSRITEPSAGRVTLRGRVASLLEVGTGFHPELTGRENIWLNGAILGMTRAEIRLLFDQIVEFAGVERFLDTPVKRYSSGMYVRLAFSVAAHLEPEILVVDEVLAVGDAEFQRRCLGKMQEVAGAGRTVLFVSHNLGAVAQLCSRAILLKNGGVAAEGTPDDVIEIYGAGAGNGTFRPVETDVVTLDTATLLPRSTALRATEHAVVELGFCVRRACAGLRCLLSVETPDGMCVFQTTDQASRGGVPYALGPHRARIVLPRDLLGERTYLLKVRFGVPGETAILPATVIGVLGSVSAHHGGSLQNEGRAWPGLIEPAVEWQICAGARDRPGHVTVASGPDVLGASINQGDRS